MWGFIYLRDGSHLAWLLRLGEENLSHLCSFALVVTSQVLFRCLWQDMAVRDLGHWERKMEQMEEDLADIQNFVLSLQI
jgi:hypothetical protein